MNFTQWMFHYIEICETEVEQFKIQNEIKELDMLRLKKEFDFLYWIIVRQNTDAIEIVEKEKKKYYDKTFGILNDLKENQQKLTETKEEEKIEGYDLTGLSDEDKELIKFMTSVPLSFEIEEEEKGSVPILPTVDVEKIMGEMGSDVL